MSQINYTHAVSLIFDLKQSIGDLWEKYGDDLVLDGLIYSESEYGLMQREELKEVKSLLAHLKRLVDGLSNDCRDTPMDIHMSPDSSGRITRSTE